MKQARNGLRRRPRYVAKRLARAMRVLLPAGLRVPPLILRITTMGRKLRSVRLL